MTYTYREKNIYGKFGLCGCDNSNTRAFCQSDFCAELAQDGSIIYRGDAHRNQNEFAGIFVNIPPLRNEGGYSNENGLGRYDNVNKSIGHRAPCNLQLEIYNATNQNYCTDCGDLNGIYDSVHIFDYDGANSFSSYTGSTWFWPLCRPDKLGNSCGASWVYGTLGFDNNDGFNPSVDTVRDVYFKIRVENQAIDYSPVGGLPNLCANVIISGCNSAFSPASDFDTSMIRKQVKVGEIKYKKYAHPSSGYGYYDSNVNCTSFQDLEITDETYSRDYCDLSFKITSKNDDDLKGLRRSMAYQRQNATFQGYDGAGMHGLRYNLCQNYFNNNTPGDLDADNPNLTTSIDTYWDITRIYEKKPHFWKVNISGATGKLESLNGEHYLFIIRNELYDGHVIQKEFEKYDSEIKPEGDYGNYDAIACKTCTPAIDDVCISSMELQISNGESAIELDLLINGGNSTYGNFTIRYDGTASHSSNKGWLAAPLTLTFDSATGAAAATLGNQNNIRGLTITIENANTWSEVDQLACYPVPRNSICHGGKEPDAFLVEFTDSWQAGYMAVRRPVYWDNAVRGGPWGTCWGCLNGQCDSNNVLKQTPNCYLCQFCDTNCNNQDWSGPVGSFLLTKVANNRLSAGGTCFPEMECNNIFNPIIYAYKNGTDETICSWSSIALHLIKGQTLPCVGTNYDNPKHIGIAMRVNWSNRNTQEDPAIQYCQEHWFHPDACLACGGFFGGSACLRASTGPDVACSGVNTCNASYAEACDGRCDSQDPSQVTQDPSAGSFSLGRFFYASLPITEFENFTYTDCANANGYDLTWYDANNYYQQCGSYYGYCSDETAPGSPPTFHGNWGGGTVKVTPIFYE